MQVCTRANDIKANQFDGVQQVINFNIIMLITRSNLFRHHVLRMTRFLQNYTICPHTYKLKIWHFLQTC